MKRIIHCHPSGIMASKFVLPLIRYEKRIGYKSNIVVSSNGENIVDGVIIKFDLNLKNILILPLSFIRLYIYFYSQKPEILVCHNFKSSLIPLCAGVLAGIPCRIYFNHGIPFIAYKGIPGLLLKWLEKANLFFSTQVITVSRELKEILETLYSGRKINQIGNGSACGIEFKI